MHFCTPANLQWTDPVSQASRTRHASARSPDWKTFLETTLPTNTDNCTGRWWLASRIVDSASLQLFLRHRRSHRARLEWELAIAPCSSWALQFRLNAATSVLWFWWVWCCALQFAVPALEACRFLLFSLVRHQVCSRYRLRVLLSDRGISFWKLGAAPVSSCGKRGGKYS